MNCSPWRTNTSSVTPSTPVRKARSKIIGFRAGGRLMGPSGFVYDDYRRPRLTGPHRGAERGLESDRRSCAMEMPSVSVMIRAWDVRLGATAAMTLDAARRAEGLGLDGIMAGDHVTFYGYGNDGLITLAAMAAVTERVQLKTSVYLLPLRHPVPVALQVAQIDQLSMGRLVLGVGIGGEDPHEFWSCGVDPRTRGARTNEAIQILRRLWREDGVTFAGRHFQLENVTVYPRPFRPVPIFVGGRSDAALVRAGRYGDGYTGIWQSVERFQQAREIISEEAAGAGRDPAGVEMGIQFWTSAGPDRSAARGRVADRMEAMYRVPFERFERYTPYGTPAEVAEFIARYVEAGASHVNLVTAQDTLEETVERAAEVREALIALC
ncbi:MAG: LLM class flavin-dependent oxidoreductase [Chloroflexi bacterium CFX7]|nr:LLM class flavin-dependent oxidoreductase [Chloroflexi bacterium CFX7]